MALRGDQRRSTTTSYAKGMSTVVNDGSYGYSGATAVRTTTETFTAAHRESRRCAASRTVMKKFTANGKVHGGRGGPRRIVRLKRVVHGTDGDGAVHDG